MAKESEDDKFQLRQIRGMKDRRYQLPGEYPMILHVDQAVAAVSARVRMSYEWISLNPHMRTAKGLHERGVPERQA